MKYNRKNRSFKSTSVLVFILILALGTLGVGYGTWGQTLKANGKVSTGSWTNISVDKKTNDDGSTGNINDPSARSSWSLPAKTWLGTRVTNNKANSTASNSAITKSGNTSNFSATITMSITGSSYSGSTYNPSLLVSITNNSSIPLKVNDSVGSLPSGDRYTSEVYRVGYTIDGVFYSGHAVTIPDGKTAYFELDIECSGSKLKQNFGSNQAVDVGFTINPFNSP